MGTPDRACLPQDFRSLALSQVEMAAARCVTQVEVPESAVSHIIGKSHRSIIALGQMPGIRQVSVHDDLEDEDKQLVKIEGSPDAFAKVLTQIKRLHLQSYAASVHPDMHFFCFTAGASQDSQSDDPLILRIASEEKLLLYLPQHLRTFLHRNFPEDFDDRTYYYFHSKSSGEAAAIAFIVQPNLALEEYPHEGKKPSIKKKFLVRSRASQILGSWESTAYRPHLADTLTKLLLGLKGETPKDGGGNLKLRLVIGKTLFYGTDLRKGVLWKLSVDQMDEKILHQALRPLFSTHSSPESVCNARQYLGDKGYQRVGVSRMISVQLVDVEGSELDKATYHMKLSEGWNEAQHDPPVARFHKVAKKHAFLTFVNEHKGVDLELRIQSRQSEVSPDPKKSKLLIEAWQKLSLSEVEDSFVSPAGGRYYPLNVLHKNAETYTKDGFAVVITEVTAGDSNHDHGVLANQQSQSLSSRWKISIRSLQLQILLRKTVPELEIGNHVQGILHHVDRLLCEASKLVGCMAVSDYRHHNGPC